MCNKYKIFLVLNLCTENDSVIDYYNELDKILGNERPDNVAYKVYNDSSLDWIILLSNNILNIRTIILSIY